MRFSVSMILWPAASLGAALMGCGGDVPTVPSELPPELPPAAAAIALVSGDGQEGKAGEKLPEPFMVRVTDARGEGVEGVRVAWSVTSGAGHFGFSGWSSLRPARFPGGHLPTLSSDTDPEGVARAFFFPTALGTSTVTADAVGLEGSPVTFSTEANGVLIRYLAMADSPFGAFPFSLLAGACNAPPDAHRFIGPEGSTDVLVPVGTPVEWLSGACEARIASSSVPPGGESFDSGFLREGGRFEFVPRLTGTWEYEDQRTGAIGTLTAQ